MSTEQPDSEAALQKKTLAFLCSALALHYLYIT